MQEAKVGLLIVDDEPSIRTSMSHVLIEIGYRVRTASDGFSALQEIRQEIPDIVLTDLNMPGMSGFELLSTIQSQFPGIQTIAMSGSFCGDEVPCGVAADAFFQKGSSMGSLLRIMETLPKPEQKLSRQSYPLESVGFQSIEHTMGGDAGVAIARPERRGGFIAQVDGGSV